MRRTGLAVAILLAALALNGCGGGEENPAPANGGTSNQTTTTGGVYGY
jgi:hypothetical protein